MNIKTLFERGLIVITGEGKIGEPETISLGQAAIAVIDNWLLVREDYTISTSDEYEILR